MYHDRTATVTTHGDRGVVITRAFDAPRRLVFAAMSDPAYVRRWLLGPPGWEMTECVNDVRVGGAYRHAWRHTATGRELVMHGVYREVEPPRRVVRTEVFDLGPGMPPAEQLATLELAEAGGRTTATITLSYASKAARDAALASGMERGAAASYDRLDGVLAELFAGQPAPTTDSQPKG